MIKMLRVDERLIHGQVACTWVNHLGVDRIVIANDGAASDEVQQMALKMAAPEGVKVAIKGVAGAIKLLQDPRMGALKVLVLVKTPADAVSIAEAVSGIEAVNVGNFGLFNDGNERKTIAYTINATEGELVDLRKLAEVRPDANYQPTAANPPQSLASVVS